MLREAFDKCRKMKLLL